MNFKRARISRQREEIFLNLTSLIDVILILLLFFMMTTNFTHNKILSVNLPSASSATTQPEKNLLVIGIDNNGAYHINNAKLADNKRETLLLSLQKILVSRSNTAQEWSIAEIPVQLSGDAKAPNQAIVTVLDVLGELGFAKVQIATTPGLTNS